MVRKRGPMRRTGGRYKTTDPGLHAPGYSREKPPPGKKRPVPEKPFGKEFEFVKTPWDEGRRKGEELRGVQIRMNELEGKDRLSRKERAELEHLKRRDRDLRADIMGDRRPGRPKPVSSGEDRELAQAKKLQKKLDTALDKTPLSLLPQVLKTRRELSEAVERFEESPTPENRERLREIRGRIDKGPR